MRRNCVICPDIFVSSIVSSILLFFVAIIVLLGNHHHTTHCFSYRQVSRVSLIMRLPIYISANMQCIPNQTLEN